MSFLGSDRRRCLNAPTGFQAGVTIARYNDKILPRDRLATNIYIHIVEGSQKEASALRPHGHRVSRSVVCSVALYDLVVRRTCTILYLIPAPP